MEDHVSTPLPGKDLTQTPIDTEPNETDDHKGKQGMGKRVYSYSNDGGSVSSQEKDTCSEKDIEGNLLSNVVTMHMTKCNDDYSPSLAICDIFSKSIASSNGNETSVLTKEETNKDEFLIIDLDTCQTERSSKQVCKSGMSGQNVKNKNDSNSKDLIQVNLSLHEEDRTHFLNKTVENHNFLQDCESMYYDNVFKKHNEHSHTDANSSKLNEEEIDISTKNNNQTKYDMKNIIDLNKGMLFPDMPTPSNDSKEMYSTDVSFQSNDLNDVSQDSHENQECEPSFYMPEIYGKLYDEEEKSNDHVPYSFNKFSTYSSSIETDSSFQCHYECSINENSFDNSMSTNNYNSIPNELYDHNQSNITPQYGFEEKCVNKTFSVDKNGIPSVYSLPCQQENTHCFHTNNKTNKTSGSQKLPYSASQDHASTYPLLQPSYLSNYHTSYPYISGQPVTDVNPPILASTAPNYTDWNSWNGSTVYEVNLNTFATVPNMDTHSHHEKEEWSNDASMSNFFQDQELSIKPNHVDNDSEATEDADETDEMPMFLDNSTDFSTGDNLSTMSVMSGSCYSDRSSVMTPMSPPEFTPPPSTSNTPILTHNQDLNIIEGSRFSYPLINETSRSEAVHLYSPTMAPYKITNEKLGQSFINYGRNQGIKRYYPSMADMHNSQSSLSLPSSKLEQNEMFDFSDYRKCNKNQIQSDKISTSTTRNKSATIGNDNSPSLECFTDYIKQEGDFRNDARLLRHNEPLKQTAIRIMLQWYQQHLDNPYPTKDDKIRMARDGGITVTQVKSWFANKRNRTNNTKPKVQKRAMKEKLKKLFQDLKHSRNDSLDNSSIIQQLSGIIQ